MAGFRYSAIGKRGAVVKGTLAADSPRRARVEIRNLGLAPISVTQIRPDESALSVGLRERRPSTAHLCLTTRQLAGLFAAKVPIDEALIMAIKQSESEPLKKALTAVRADVLAGSSLSSALNEWPSVFSPLYCAITEAGESSGALDAVFLRLADYLEQSHQARQRIGLALIYPAIVSLVAVTATIGILIFVVPQIVSVFEKTSQTLPLLTRVLIATSNELIQHWWLYLAGLAGGVVTMSILIKQSTSRMVIEELLLKIPVIGQLIIAVNTERLAQTLAMLTENGVSLIPALAAATKTVTSRPLVKSLELARRSVGEGVRMSVALKESSRFTSLLIGYVESGEKNGRLAEMLKWAARQQSRELEFRINAMMAVFEPTLIVIMGGVTLLTALAILLPIFEMSQIVR